MAAARMGVQVFGAVVARMSLAAGAGAVAIGMVEAGIMLVLAGMGVTGMALTGMALTGMAAVAGSMRVMVAAGELARR